MAKVKTLQIRISEFDKNRLKILAKKYAEGSMTAWVVHGIHNAPREFLKLKKESLRKTK